MPYAVCVDVVAHGAPRNVVAMAPPPVRVLAFSKTSGFRHESIAAGLDAIRGLGITNGFVVDATEDASVFAASQLAGYDAIVFLSTTGDVLSAEQQAAFEEYVRQGGGYVGIHAASDTEYDWAFDEWYDFNENPRDRVHVLLSLDPDSVS
jgi:type 1 glutamine amidotransferase